MKRVMSITVAAVLATALTGLAEEVTNVTWKSSLSLGATYKSGNTDKQLYTMNLKGDRFAPASDWISSLYGEYGKTEGAQTEGQLRGQSNYRYKFGSENFFGGVFSEGYHDVIKDIKVRVKVGPNIGYYFINREEMKLDASIGINEVYERVGEDEDDYADWRLAANYLWSITDTSSFYVNMEYSAAVEDSEQGSGLMVVGAKSALNERLSLFVEARQEYENKPEPGTEHTDTTVMAGLTYDIM